MTQQNNSILTWFAVSKLDINSFELLGKLK